MRPPGVTMLMDGWMDGWLSYLLIGLISIWIFDAVICIPVHICLLQRGSKAHRFFVPFYLPWSFAYSKSHVATNLV